MQDLRGKRGLNYGDYSYIEDFIQEGGEHLPRPEQPAPAAVLLDLDPPRARTTRPSSPSAAALWELDRLVEDGMSAGRLRGDPLVPAQLQQALGPDPLATPRLRDGRRVLRPRRPRDRAGRAPAEADRRAGQRRRPHATSSRPASRSRSSPGTPRRSATLLPPASRPRSPTTPRGPPRTSSPRTRQIAAFPLEDVKVKIVPVVEMFEK